jgi:hypothetical protein
VNEFTPNAECELIQTSESETHSVGTPLEKPFVNNQAPLSGDPRVLLETLPPGARMVEISPRLADRTGTILRSLIPSACASAILSFTPTWEQLSETTVAQIQQWHGVGAGRASRIIEFVLSLSVAPKTLAASPDDKAQIPNSLARALALVAGWALTRGTERGLGEAIKLSEGLDVPPAVTTALHFLRELDLHSLANKDDMLLFDPVKAAVELLAEFETNDLAILDRLLARGLRPISTLEDIGLKFNVTRERVRQLEVQIANRLARLLETEKYASVRRHADTLTDLLGAAFPVKDLPSELVPESQSSLVDELFAHLAGPFLQSDGWFVRKDTAVSIEDLLRKAYASSESGFIAPLDALNDALESTGVRTERTLEVIAACPRYRLINDSVVPWSGIREKVVGVLQAIGRPMSFEEIQTFVLDGESASSVRNVLASSPLVKRLKKNEWGLASWEGAEYRTIVDHMRDELQGGSLAMHELVIRLHEKFDISTTSSTMYATMHPMFVNTGGHVRIRREDEPYIPTTSLEMTPDCFQIDGVWSVCYTVDKDLMRGSGRVMPEAFAVHLGLQPGGNGELQAFDRVVKVGWGMNPFFGSLRWVVEKEGLSAGDLLVVIRVKSSELGFRFVRAHELVEALPAEERLKKLVGAANSGLVLERWLGDALGLGGASMPSITQLKARLQARGEKKLVALLEDAEK